MRVAAIQQNGMIFIPCTHLPFTSIKPAHIILSESIRGKELSRASNLPAKLIVPILQYVCYRKSPQRNNGFILSPGVSDFRFPI